MHLLYIQITEQKHTFQEAFFYDSFSPDSSHQRPAAWYPCTSTITHLAQGGCKLNRSRREFGWEVEFVLLGTVQWKTTYSAQRAGMITLACCNAQYSLKIYNCSKCQSWNVFDHEELTKQSRCKCQVRTHLGDASWNRLSRAIVFFWVFPGAKKK